MRLRIVCTRSPVARRKSTSTTAEGRFFFVWPSLSLNLKFNHIPRFIVRKWKKTLYMRRRLIRTVASRKEKRKKSPPYLVFLLNLIARKNVTKTQEKEEARKKQRTTTLTSTRPVLFLPLFNGVQVESFRSQSHLISSPESI